MDFRYRENRVKRLGLEVKKYTGRPSQKEPNSRIHNDIDDSFTHEINFVIEVRNKNNQKTIDYRCHAIQTFKTKTT